MTPTPEELLQDAQRKIAAVTTPLGEAEADITNALAALKPPPPPVEEPKPPPPPAGIVVAKAPLGPSVPSGGWSVAYADGFGLPIGNSPGQDNTWIPNTGKSAIDPAALALPPNTNNTDVTSSSQISVDGEGVHLACVYRKGVGAAKRANLNYLSGCLEGNWPGGPSAAGYHCPLWNPAAPGVTWAFEIVCKWPVNTGEMDPAFWADGPSLASSSSWPDEWDFFEGGGWGSQYKAGDGLGGWGKAGIYVGAVGPMRSIKTQWNGYGFDPTAAYHRYTVLIKPDSSWQQYVDGLPRLSGPTNAPVPCAMPLLLRNDTREYAGQVPFTGLHTFSIRSVAIYQDAGHAGDGITNGGVAPGTSIEA